MDRRKFLKSFGVASAVAGASAAVSYPMGHFFRHVSTEDNGERLSIEERVDRVIQQMMDTYEIPTLEQAQKLYLDMDAELSHYYASGAVLGSAWRSLSNEFLGEMPENRLLEIARRGNNVFVGAGLADLISTPAQYAVEKIQDSPLMQPETLVSEYGMPQDKAQLFCKRYKENLSRNMFAGACSLALLQEIFLPDPKGKELANTPDVEPR